MVRASRQLVMNVAASGDASAALFPVPGRYTEHRGPAVAEHYSSASLEELFNSATAEAYHGSPHFRAELLRCETAVKCMFATQSFAEADGESWAFANSPDIAECRRQGTFEAIRDSNREQLDAVLSANVGPSAPTAEEFVAAFVRTCGPRRRGMFTALTGTPPRNALEWHQDWGPPDAESLTVMLAFPPAEYAGDLGEEEGGGSIAWSKGPLPQLPWPPPLPGGQPATKMQRTSHLSLRRCK